MRIRLVMGCLAAMACSRSNSTYMPGQDLSSGSDDLSLSGDDLSGGGDGAFGDGALGDGALGDGALGDGALGDGGGDGGSISCVADVPCFSGSDATKRNVGSCHDGVQHCVNNVLGPCSGEVLPSSESCNGLDDDCDGTADNGLGTISCGVGACARPTPAPEPACVNGAPNPVACVPGAPSAEICGDGIDQNCDGVPDDGCSCIYVAPPCGITPTPGCYAAAADILTCGNLSQPCATVKYAIESRATAGNTVCVASTAKCSAVSASRTVFNYVEQAITMKDGVSLLGGYNLTPTPSPSPVRVPTACVTRISVNSHNAVTFGAGVTTPTTIDGFEIVNTDTTDNITAGVAVVGSTGAVISDNYIFGGGGTAQSHGVRIMDSGGNAATPLLLRNAIVGGTAPTAIGVSSTNSTPTVRDHCDTINAGTGRCSSLDCNPAGGAHIGLGFIHGRTPGGGNRTNAYGILLTNSPGALIETNSISGSQCPGGLVTNGDVVGVWITGDASNTILRGNFIDALQAGNNAVGVWADTCAGAGPSLWLFNNEHISGNSPQVGCLGDGVRAEGNCHPRIDSNNLIRGGEEGSQSPANGVYCKSGSQCTILNNTEIDGSVSGFPPTSAGIRCDDNSCGRIEGNRVSGRAGIDTFGIILGATGVLVTTNLIDAGCTMSGTAVGVESVNAFSQLQNNVIRGVVCSNATTADSWAVRDAPGNNTNELDVNGNDLIAGGDPNGNACVSQAIGILDRGQTAPRGLYRNNILHAGFCPTSYDVNEETKKSTARVFLNNDLWHTGVPTALYYSGGASLLTTIAAVNMLTDPAGSNFEADPLFTTASPIVFPLPANPNYHLQAGSPCIDKGANAPSTDFDFPGNLSWQSGTMLRTGIADVGADER